MTSSCKLQKAWCSVASTTSSSSGKRHRYPGFYHGNSVFAVGPQHHTAHAHSKLLIPTDIVDTACKAAGADISTCCSAPRHPLPFCTRCAAPWLHLASYAPDTTPWRCAHNFTNQTTNTTAMTCQLHPPLNLDPNTHTMLDAQATQSAMSPTFWRLAFFGLLRSG